MIRYVGIKDFKSKVWVLHTRPLAGPYLKLQIKIIGKEDRYDFERSPKKLKKSKKKVTF